MFLEFFQEAGAKITWGSVNRLESLVPAPLRTMMKFRLPEVARLGSQVTIKTDK